MLSKCLPGKSEKWLALNASSPKEARLVLIALYAVCLIPLMLVFKRWVADVLFSLVALCFLFNSYLTKNWQWLREPLVKLFIALSLYLLLVVSPLAIAPYPSFIRALIWWHYPLFFLAMIYWLSDYTQEMKRVFYAFAIILTLICIDGIVQHLTRTSISGELKPIDRLTGPFTSPVIGIFIAKLGLPVIGAILFYSWHTQRKMAVTLSLLFACITTVTVTISNERTALICYLSGLLIASVIVFARVKSARKLIAIAAALQCAVVFVSYVTQLSVRERIWRSIDQIESFSATEYAQLWKASILIWQDSPLNGAGLMNFRSSCEQLLQEGKVIYCNLHSHNIYLEWLSEAGIIGFLGLIAMVYLIFRMILRQMKSIDEASAILIAFAFAGLAPNFFPLAATQSFFSNWPAMLMWLSLGLSVGLVRSIRHA